MAAGAERGEGRLDVEAAWGGVDEEVEAAGGQHGGVVLVDGAAQLGLRLGAAFGQGIRHRDDAEARVLLQPVRVDVSAAAAIAGQADSDDVLHCRFLDLTVNECRMGFMTMGILTNITLLNG